MKRMGFLGVTLMAALTTQMVVPRFIGGWGGPQLLLLMTLWVGWRRGPLTGELAGFLGGLLADACSLAPFGSQTALLTLVGYIAGMERGRLDEQNLIAQVILAVIVSAGYLVGMMLIAQVVRAVHPHQLVDGIWRWGGAAWSQPFWDGAAAPLVFRVLHIWEGWWRLSDPRHAAGYFRRSL